MIYYVGNYAFDSDYIEHSGIKGQKWGIRRFENYDGTLTEEGKLRYYASKVVDGVKTAKNRIAEKKKAAYEKNRAKALKTGDAAEVSKYKDTLSPKEFDDVLKRLTNEARLAQLSENEKPNKKQKSVWNLFKKATDIMNTLANTKKSYENMVNSLKEKEVKEPTEGELDAKQFLEAYREKCKKTPGYSIPISSLTEMTQRINMWEKIDKASKAADAYKEYSAKRAAKDAGSFKVKETPSQPKKRERENNWLFNDTSPEDVPSKKKRTDNWLFG